MKIEIDAGVFANAINWVTKTFDMKSDKTIEFFCNDSGEGHLSYYGSDSYLKCGINATSVKLSKDEPKEFLLNMSGRYLKNLANAISKVKTITLEYKGGTSSYLTAKSSFGKFDIPISNIPHVTPPKWYVVGNVDDNEFFSNLTRFARMCATDDSLTDIASVNLDFYDDRINMQATDRYICGDMFMGYEAELEMGHNKSDDHLQVHLPAHFASLISPTKGITSSVTLIASNKGEDVVKFGYIFPDSRVALFSVVTANFPPVEPLFDNVARDRHADFDHNEFRYALGVLRSLTWDDKLAHCTFKSPELVVLSNTNRSSAINVAVESNLDDTYDYEGDYLPLNTDFLSKIIGIISSKRFRIFWTKDKAVIFQQLNDDGSVQDNLRIICVMRRS